MDEFDKFKAAIFGQESGNGTVPTSTPNYAGALGKGQILESTFKGLQAAGKVPATAQWTNPADNELASVAYMQEAWDAAGGDPRRAAAYYYGGPKAIKGGGIVEFGDKLNSKAPTTSQYAEQVASRMGSPRVPLEKQWEASTDAVFQAGLHQPSNPKVVAERTALEQWQQQIEIEARPTALESVGAAIKGNTSNSIIRALFRPRFEAEAGYKPDYSLAPPEAGSELLEQMAGSKSSAETAHILAAYQEEQFRVAALMDRGVSTGVISMIGGEILDPINWLMPFAATKGLAKLGIGSEVLMAAGRTGAGYASAIGENVLSGTALEAVKQSLQGEFKPLDLGVSIVADALIGLGAGALTARHASELLANKAVDAAIIREVALAERAVAKLGPDATPEELRAAMHQEYTADLNGRISDSVASVPAERRLIPEEASMEAAPKGWGSIEETPKAAVPEGKFTKFDPSLTDEFVAGAKPGVHLSPTVVNDPSFVALKDTVDKLTAQMLPPGHKVILSSPSVVKLPDGSEGMPSGVHLAAAKDTSVILVKPGELSQGTAVHELGHAVEKAWYATTSPAIKDGVTGAYADWLATYTTPRLNKTALVKRGPVYRLGTEFDDSLATAADGTPRSLRDIRAIERGDKYADNYYDSFSEFLAEQFNKHVEAAALGQGANPKLSVPEGVVQFAKDMMKRFVDLFKRALHLGYVKPDTRMDDFFKDIYARREAMDKATMAPTPASFSVPAKPEGVVNEIMTDPDAIRFGLNMAPVGTAAERKQVQAMVALHKKAEQWEKANPFDDAWKARAQSLADNNVFNVSSIGLTMLKSPSPLLRMIASELVEDASGVAGKRHNTASISKYLLERQMTGNTINDVQSAYDLWKVSQPGSGLKDDLFGGHTWDRWNKELAAEIEARRLAGAPVNLNANVKAAVDSIEASYQRIADAQRKVNTLGSEGLPTSSVGYMPHRMSPGKVVALTNEQLQVVHSELVDQFITIEGWDQSFADKLAASYLHRVRARAAGDYGSNIGGAGAASLVEEALRKMDLPEDTITAHMEKFNKGAAGYTKGRIELDLNRVHTTPTGDFKLLDIFETDQIELLRSQAGSASGDVALTKHGVRGKPGLQLLRTALQYGEDGKRIGAKEFEAFDQMAAEFRNEPFGTHTGKWLDRAMQANTLVRLGGIAFNQLAETINGIAHVGAARAFETITSIPRLRSEILALAKGEKVANSIIGSIEQAGGAEFGTDAYKFVMPFDSPNHAFPTYGQDTLTATDRLLRGGGHLQAKLSGWRAIHSAQQRGMAEQIVHKMMRYVRDGKEDIALDQFGINSDIRAALKKDLNAIAKWDGDRLIEFDVTKITDADVRDQVIQAVWRGTSQIIQGTYIGERGKWAHDGLLKLMTQFRTFGITSMEKQWGRQRNSRGAYSAFGLLLGSMAMVTPIVFARVYANSIGRPDQEQYIADRTSPLMVARATLNYVASAGMASDVIDMTSSMLPEGWGVKPTGGRSGVESDFVGNYIAPASSLVNDIWKYAQSPLQADDAAKLMPMRNVPYLLPLMNLTKD